MVLERSPFSLDRKKWSSVERENLAKGIKQQFQEILLQMSINQDSSEWSCGYANNFDNMLVSIKDLEITPENIRKFLPEFNWDQLASKYVTGRTGAECEARMSFSSSIAGIYDDTITDSLSLLGFNKSARST